MFYLLKCFGPCTAWTMFQMNTEKGKTEEKANQKVSSPQVASPMQAVNIQLRASAYYKYIYEP